MKQVVVETFGGPEELKLREVETPAPGKGQVRVRLTSIGMNHADLMARKGQYKIASGDPPFTPGIEGGGVIEAVGDGVEKNRVGQRIVLTPDAPRKAAGGSGGTYQSHYLCQAEQAMPAPDAIPDDQLGALWLPYLTAWGCLVWKQNLQPGQVVAIPAASSSVALAAAQIAKLHGATTIGLTTSPSKVERIEQLDTAVYDHLVVTHERDPESGEKQMKPWHREFRKLAPDGVDLFFDPVAAGAYLNTEIKCLAQFGCIWVYGLLGRPDVVDVTPLIRKFAAIRGWALTEFVLAGREAWEPACQAILDRFADGTFRQYVDKVYTLDNVQQAQIEMAKGTHIGKLVIVP